jgi:hypothetical protein
MEGGNEMKTKNLFQAFAGIAGLALLAGCGGGGGGDGQAAAPTEQDLTVTLQGMTPHVDQLTELRVVARDAPRALAAKVILDPLPSATFAVTLPKALPSGSFDLDFFSDLNGNRAYNDPPADHAWRVAIPSTGQVSFAHNAGFTPIGAAAGSEGSGFTLNFTGMTPHVGQLMELRVIKASNGQTVGAYRLGAVPDAAFSLAIPGIIQNGQGYRVDFFADLNGNGTYDAPPADHAWQLTGTGTASGLSLDFAHNANFTDIKLVSSGAPAAAARGTITGFGSVKVNGVEFETTGATRFKVDDNAGATENNLKVGMVVNVKGRIADDGVHGTATEIEFENSIEGPVGTVSLAAGNITVMGKTIKLNDVTIFEGKAAGQLQTGDLVEVSGVEAANGTILARRIELKGAGDTEAEIKGALSNLTSTTFTLGGLTVNYASAAIDNSVAAAGGLKNGLFVEVKGAPPPSGGVLTATRVELDDDGVPEAEGAEVRLEGLVTEVTAGSASGTSEFKVDGHPVKAAAGVFKRGVPTDLAVGLSVEAEGVIDAAGALVAKEVSFELARNVKIEGDVQSVNAVAGTVRVLGVDVNVDSSTQLRDKRTDGDFGLADLAAGDRVSVRAFIDPVSNTAVQPSWKAMPRRTGQSFRGRCPGHPAIS